MAVFGVVPLAVALATAYIYGRETVQRAAAARVQAVAELKARQLHARMVLAAARAREFAGDFRARSDMLTVAGSAVRPATMRRWLAEHGMAELDLLTAVLDLQGRVVATSADGRTGEDWRGLPELDAGRVRVAVAGPHVHAVGPVQVAAYAPLRTRSGATVAELAVIGSPHALRAAVYGGVPVGMKVRFQGPVGRVLPTAVEPTGTTSSVGAPRTQEGAEVGAPAGGTVGSMIVGRARVGWRWSAVTASIQRSEVLARLRRAARIALLLFALATAASLATAFFVGRGVSRPVIELARASRRIAAGDLSPQPIPQGDDEIGRLGRELDAMRTALAAARRSLTAELDEASAELAARNRLLVALFGSLPDPVLVVDGDRHIVAANPRAGELLGADPVGRSCFAALGGRSTPCDSCPLADLAENAEAVDAAPRRVHLGGEIIDFVVAPVTDGAEGSRRGVYVGRAVTRELGLLRSLAHQEKMAAVGSLAAGVTHEIRNPLASLSSLLQLRLRSAEDPDERHDLNLALEQLARIDRTVGQLVGLGRKPRRTPGLVRLGELVTRATRLVAFDPRARGVSIRLDPGSDDPLLLLDEDAWFQAILNLLINALDAVGGCPERRIKVSQRVAGGHVTIVVQDTGVGMSAEVLARAREAGYTTKPRDRGTGLGLHIVARAAAEAGADLVIRSERGRGTEVRIVLPMPDADDDGSTEIRTEAT